MLEFDCRPPRTTVTSAGLARFLENAANYWRTLEAAVQVYLGDPSIQELEEQLNRPGEAWDVEELQRGFAGFETAAAVDTECIQAYQNRVREILLGRA